MLEIKTAGLYEAINMLVEAYPLIFIIFLVLACAVVWINRKRPE
jgi:hypothetical protein